MASGLEVLGALAAASQIAEQVLRIVKLVQSIRDAPEEVLQHIASLQQLASVVESIKANPSYQSRQVAEILSLINTKTSAISDTLDKLQTDPSNSKASVFKKAVNSTWNSDNVANKLDQIERDKTTLALCLAQIDAQVQSEQIRNLSSQLQGLHNAHHTSTLTEEQWRNYCLAELFITNPVDDRAMLTRTKGTRSEGTCIWVTDHPTYRSWLDPACQSPLLWISGGPGKGKTMISVFLTEELEQLAVQSHGSTQQVIYFFCDNKDNKRNKASCVLRGLILQIMIFHPDSITHLLPDFKIQRSRLFEENSFDSLWRVFACIIRSMDVDFVSCVLDGMDELEDSALNTLLLKLRNLRVPKLKIIALSRHFPQSISDALSDYPTIRLDPDSGEEISRDVETYVLKNVKELSRVKQYSPELERHVLETLKLRSEGTFLWISFAVDILRKVSSSETATSLRSLPVGLDAIYGRVLLSISKHNSSLVGTMLRWTTLTVRPLKLAELGAALGQPSSAGLNLGEATKDRIQLCSGLLVLDGDTVTLVHQSFKDYLLRSEPDPNPALELYRINPEKGNCEIAERCLEYLSEKSPHAIRSERWRVKREPFLRYATRHWLLHARASTSFGQKEHAFSSFFGHKKATAYVWLREYNQFNCGFSFDFHNVLWSEVFLCSNPLFMIATALLISNLALKYWQRPRAWKKLTRFREHSRMLTLAFSIATVSGNVEIARFLLSQGANVNRAYKRHSISFNPPLHLAAMNDREDMVKFLLSKTANLEKKDLYGRTALLEAVRSRASRSLLALLLEAGADIATSDVKGRQPLHEALCRQNNELVVRALIQHGAKINSRTGNGITPLHLAAVTASPGVLGILLRKGADIKALDNNGKTAKQRAQEYLDNIPGEEVWQSLKRMRMENIKILQDAEEGILPLVAASLTVDSLSTESTEF